LYMQQRYYDPIAGRFLSVDPVTTDAKTGGHFNRYAYADNNPYKYTDPDGRSPKLLVDFGLNVALNVLTTGELGLASAAKETLVGALNPAKTVQTAVKLGGALKVTAKELRAAGKADFNAARPGKLAENGGTCTYCGNRPSTEVDHVKPLKSFADDVNAGKMTKADAVKEANAPGNLAGACTSCNRGEGGKHAKELGDTPSKDTWVAPNGFKRD
jgi:uncharacterized protein RhaS with RHS repeats